MSQMGDFRIQLSELQPNPELLRSVDRDSEEYQEFASSIRAKGVLQPILVRPIPADRAIVGGPKYFIIEGLQRYSASKDAGFSDIPARITEMSDDEVSDAQIIANSHRIITKPKEFASAIARMLARNPMMTKQDVADRYNKSLSWVGQQLAMNKLNENVGELVDTQKIPVQNALLLTKLSSDDQTLFANDAMTKDNPTLAAAINTHLKEQKDARKQGRPAGPVEYVPTAHFIKAPEAEALYRDDNSVSMFLKEQGIKTTADTVLAARTAFLKMVNLDPISVKARKEQYELDKKEREKQAAIKKDEREKNKTAEAAATRARLETELAGAV